MSEPDSATAAATCSSKSCRRPVDSTFKSCQTCREKARGRWKRRADKLKDEQTIAQDTSTASEETAEPDAETQPIDRAPLVGYSSLDEVLSAIEKARHLSSTLSFYAIYPYVHRDGLAVSERLNIVRMGISEVMHYNFSVYDRYQATGPKSDTLRMRFRCGQDRALKTRRKPSSKRGEHADALVRYDCHSRLEISISTRPTAVVRIRLEHRLRHPPPSGSTSENEKEEGSLDLDQRSNSE